jgi:hypothetical protein
MWDYRCFDTHIKDNRSINSFTASTNKKKISFLVLDQGTSSTKSFLFDIQGTLEHSAKIKHSLDCKAHRLNGTPLRFYN